MTDSTERAMANSLPNAVEQIAEELRESEDYVRALVDKLQVDPTKHSIPLVRAFQDEYPLNPDELPDDEVAALRQRILEEAKNSVLAHQERTDLAKYESQISR